MWNWLVFSNITHLHLTQIKEQVLMHKDIKVEIGHTVVFSKTVHPKVFSTSCSVGLKDFCNLVCCSVRKSLVVLTDTMF